MPVVPEVLYNTTTKIRVWLYMQGVLSVGAIRVQPEVRRHFRGGGSGSPSYSTRSTTQFALFHCVTCSFLVAALQKSDERREGSVDHALLATVVFIANALIYTEQSADLVKKCHPTCASRKPRSARTLSLTAKETLLGSRRRLTLSRQNRVLEYYLVVIERHNTDKNKEVVLAR